MVMGATLGKAFSQSVVFVWFFDRPGDGGQATASVLLPRGAEALTPQIYQQLVTELRDGGHVRYAGRGLLFVANTGGEPDGAFLDRMERARTLLGRAGVPTSPVRCERATFVAIDRASYDQIIAGGSRGSQANQASGGPEGARRPTSPDRRCAAAREGGACPWPAQGLRSPRGAQGRGQRGVRSRHSRRRRHRRRRRSQRSRPAHRPRPGAR